MYSEYKTSQNYNKPSKRELKSKKKKSKTFLTSTYLSNIIELKYKSALIYF